MKKYIFIIPLLVSVFIVACKEAKSNDNKKEAVSINSFYSLIDYPRWQHSDSTVSEYGAYYPALKLDKITLQKVKTIFGEPDEETINTTSDIIDNAPDNDDDIGLLIKRLPPMNIYKGIWYLENDFTLTLYFFYDGDSLRSFYGYKAISDYYRGYK